MGWLFTEGQTRKQLVDRLTRPWTDGDGTTYTTTASTCRGNILWQVIESSKGDAWIGCVLMKSGGQDGWGYKSMSESMGPFYYTCPLAYLGMAPEVNPAWREQVRAYHARMTVKLAVGTKAYLADCKIDYAVIISLKPLVGIGNDGRRYRIPRKYITGVE